MRRSYIGITDFLTPKQAQEMLGVFRRAGGGELQRTLMVGVMMSYKTLNGLPTKWTDAFPTKESVENIFLSHPLAFNTLHYADYDALDFAESIERATLFGGPNMHAIQLDMIWPDPRVVMEYRERHPEIQVIVQGNAKAMEVVGENPVEFARKLKIYGKAIDYVLLDKSMGKGLGMDAMRLIPFARAVADEVPDLNLAAAGGLGPDTLHLAEPLVEIFPDLSIDAQGKLRPSGNALYPIDWAMAGNYLLNAVSLFRRHKKQ